MAFKEHPFMVTRTLQGDGSTIKYDSTKKNRSEAVGKAYKINADGKGELVVDGDAIDGKVIDVEDDHKFTAAYMFGGLNFPLGDSETVSKGDRIVGALGASSAKGHVKALSLPADIDDELEAADINLETEKLVVHNATRTQINSVASALEKGKGTVLESDTSEALVAFGV